MKKLLSFLLAFMLMFSMFGCADNNIDWKAGVYTGSAEGYSGEVVVEVTLSDTGIEDIVVTQQTETADIGGVAAEKLVADIVAVQAVDVDLVSGATITSNAVVAAVTAALAEAGIDASKLVAKEKELEVIDKTVDVVVVGAGGAGMSAAIEAHNAGKSVVIIEKGSITGGNTTRATGGLNASETTEQQSNTFEENAGVEKILAKATADYPELADLTSTVQKQYDEYLANPQGYFDTNELFMLDTLVGGKNLNNHELVLTLVEQSASAIEWLKTIDADLSYVGSFGGASVKRIHKPVNEEGKTIAVGNYLVSALNSQLEALGIEVIYDRAVSSITVEDNVAVGVTGDNLTINAKSVIIATGGFAANLDMVAELNPDLKGFVTTNSPLITGDGIKMAEAAGAATVDMDQIQIHPTVHLDSSALITEAVRGDGAILVNSKGERFTNELGTRDVVSAAEIAQEGGFAYLIFDQGMVDKSAVLQGYITKGYLAGQGETIEALAENLEVDGATLKTTLESWNSYTEAKNDPDFNRTAFAEPLVSAPYYAIAVAPGIHHTMGGIQINTNAEVLDTEGNVISGLYAAGEVTGGVHGANRLGGNAVSDVIIFGRIAGQNAAANASN
ncbi:MAG: flavocytochrome c [Erysipelotrichaceae bacterium]